MHNSDKVNFSYDYQNYRHVSSYIPINNIIAQNNKIKNQGTEDSKELIELDKRQAIHLDIEKKQKPADEVISNISTYTSTRTFKKYITILTPLFILTTIYVFIIFTFIDIIQICNVCNCLSNDVINNLDSLYEVSDLKFSKLAISLSFYFN